MNRRQVCGAERKARPGYRVEVITCYASLAVEVAVFLRREDGSIVGDEGDDSLALGLHVGLWVMLADDRQSLFET